MIIHFEFTKILPKQLHAQVKYSSDGKPDVFQNLRISNFTKDALEKAAKSRFDFVVREWESIENQPESFDEEVSGEIVFKPEVIAAQPDYDDFTQKLELKNLETDTEIIRSWSIVDLTGEEVKQKLNQWREFISVTPRQARLELAKRGQLSNIDEIVASLPADQQEIVQIEWEYAVSIERSSPWVIQLGSALGLDEEGLDELFNAAAGL